MSVSLLRSALTMQATRLVWVDGEPRDVWRDMRSGGITGIHPTKRGSLYISANTPHFWKALCELTGLAELAADPRFDTVRKRAEHEAVLVPRLRAALQARTAVEWEAHFGERVPCAAARPVEDMFDHPQVAAEGILASFEHPGVGHYRGDGASGPLRRGPAARALRGAAARAALAGDPGEPRLLRRGDRAAARRARGGLIVADLLMRSKLFVPASRPELFAKALAGDADALSFDLEDAVQESRKAEARGTLEAFLRQALRGRRAPARSSSCA